MDTFNGNTTIGYTIGNNAFSNLASVRRIEYNAINSTIGTTMTARGFNNIGGTVGFDLVVGEGVTTLPQYAFRNMRINQLTLPSTITSIGRMAFAGNAQMVELNYNPTNMSDFALATNIFYNAGTARSAGMTVNIGTNVVRIPGRIFDVNTATNFPRISAINIPYDGALADIGRDAWRGNDWITTITIPNSKTALSHDSFAGYFFAQLRALEQFVVAADHPTFYAVGGILFDKGTNILRHVPRGKTGEFNIPTGTVAIADNAFLSSSLSAITIPASVLTIGEGAFRSTRNLTTMTIPATVQVVGAQLFVSSAIQTAVILAPITEIAQSMFASCAQLVSITIPATVTSVSASAFFNANAFATVYFMGTESQFNAITVSPTNNARFTQANVVLV